MSAPVGTTIRLTVPMPPNMANGRVHWRAKHRARRDYMNRLDELQGAGVIPAPPLSPLARPILSSVMHVGAKHDLDNAVARHKYALDWLQTRGYIVNDRELEWHAFPRQIVKRGQDYRLELTLIERAA